jgi:RNA polymerase sigma-70 factor (ECF subfamily)
VSHSVKRSASWGSSDPSALRLAALYRAHSVSVRSTCRAILRDAAAAEDATQETFLRVQRYLASADGMEDIAAWIHRIAFNYCLNEIRNRKARLACLERIPPARWSCDEDGLVARDQLSRLLETLPDPLRALLQLRYVDGLDQRHIAGELGVSRRTVVSRLTELRAALGAGALRRQPGYSRQWWRHREA